MDDGTVPTKEDKRTIVINNSLARILNFRENGRQDREKDVEMLRKIYHQSMNLCPIVEQ
jgi:hypothetical protein